jgi:hypothetical protein
MDYHVASMYNEYDHDAFISNANDVIEAEKEIRESEMDIEDRPEGEEYNFQAFHRDVVPVQDQEEAVDGPNDPPEGGDTVEVTAPLSLEAINLYSMFQED